MVARALIYASLLLYLTLGATVTGILTPMTRQLGIGGLIALGAAWLLGRRRWKWHATALDTAILLWIAAFGVSLIANTDQWRRIVMGLWYVGAYIVVWYGLHDVITNRRITRRVFVNGLLLAGLLIIAFGYLQTRTWFISSLPLILNGTLEFSLPRPVSTLGNANTLGAFLAVLLPFALEAARGSKGITRTLTALYFLLAIGLLLLTYSRGAWIGAAVGLGVYVLLILWKDGWLSTQRRQMFWRAGSMVQRAATIVVVIGIIAVGAVGGAVIVRSYLSEGGRSGDTRLWIYDTALRLFSEQPLSGSGLFTFGAGLARFNGTPPAEPHAHAHNIILHVAAELGVIGLLALLVTGAAAVNVSLRNLRADPLVAAGIGAFGAFAAHHVFDVPSLNPTIALVGLIALVVATAPHEPIPLTGIRQRVVRVAVPVTALILALVGVWSSIVYQQYVEIISQTASGVISPREGADRLQNVVDADPALALYSYEQGYLYGVAGETQAGIDALARYTQLDPDYPMGWLNLFALYQQAGDLPRALDAIQRAYDLSPIEPTTLYHLARTQAALGMTDEARHSYELLLNLEPDLQLMPAWDDDPLRAALPFAPLSDAGEVIRLLRSGDTESAWAVWLPSYYRANAASQTGTHVLDMLIALHEDDRAAAGTALTAAQAWIQTQGDGAWAHYGAACLALYDGDETAAQLESRAAAAALELSPFQMDWQYGVNIGYSQWMRLTITRVFLPEVEYPLVSPVLRALLETFTAADSRYTSCP